MPTHDDTTTPIIEKQRKDNSILSYQIK
jgi:hypothetical protein